MNLKRIVCAVRGHNAVPTGQLMQFLCLRCDELLYSEPIRKQAKEWGKKKYAERWQDRGKPKYCVERVAIQPLI